MAGSETLPRRKTGCVSPRDLITFALAPVFFLGVALVGSYLPARHATQVNPTEALRET